MTNMQRIKNDDATIERRQIADNLIRENRDKNDELTKERRFKADHLKEESRLKNDGITAHRRALNDRNPIMNLAIFLAILVILVAGTYFVFV